MTKEGEGEFVARCDGVAVTLGWSAAGLKCGAVDRGEFVGPFDILCELLDMRAAFEPTLVSLKPNGVPPPGYALA